MWPWINRIVQHIPSTNPTKLTIIVVGWMPCMIVQASWSTMQHATRGDWECIGIFAATAVGKFGSWNLIVIPRIQPLLSVTWQHNYKKLPHPPYYSNNRTKSQYDKAAITKGLYVITNTTQSEMIEFFNFHRDHSATACTAFLFAFHISSRASPPAFFFPNHPLHQLVISSQIKVAVWLRILVLNTAAFYFGLIQSTMEYASNSYVHSLTQSVYDKLIKCYKRSLWITFGFSRDAASSLICQRYHICPLQIRFTVKLHCLVYRCLHNLASPLLCSLFKPVSSVSGRCTTRGASSSALLLPHAKSRAGLFSLAFIAADRYNSLPAEVRTAASRFIFRYLCFHYSRVPCKKT